jgi:hypothetical protein
LEKRPALSPNLNQAGLIWLSAALFLSIAAVAIAVGGFALVSLGLACWPFRVLASRPTPALRAMLTYNLLIACYLIFLGIGGQYVGILLWPAAAIHGFLTLLLFRAWFRNQQAPASKG